LTLHAIGFGALNLDEFWEVPREFLQEYDLEPGREYVRDLNWFSEVYPRLAETALLRARDPGGSAANAMAALRKMGFDTGFYGVTGSHDREALRLEELGPEEDLRVVQVETPAGRCLALIDRDDPQKDRALVILPNANDLAGSVGFDPAYFEQAQWVHMTSFVSDSALEAQIRLARSLAGRVRVSFDPGALHAARGFAALEPLLRSTEILFATEDELALITACPDWHQSVARLLGVGVDTVVVKRGSEGISGHQHGRSLSAPGVPPRQILDRTGAGDVAAAAFLAGVILGIGLEAALELAVVAASRSIEGYGRSAYPDRDFLVKLLAERALL
jgi:ribokinase